MRNQVTASFISPSGASLPHSNEVSSARADWVVPSSERLASSQGHGITPPSSHQKKPAVAGQPLCSHCHHTPHTWAHHLQDVGTSQTS